ncbi:basic proline-rich protein-like [Antechinus flavipes]|uniref:basic proline-rich protein-like n=1 Tax=Antechinus flavipes TaxID=38775 RepID=UPI0022364C0B|nr:basic proline-rich protein-like [Antechinus flavipes]
MNVTQKEEWIDCGSSGKTQTRGRLRQKRERGEGGRLPARGAEPTGGGGGGRALPPRPSSLGPASMGLERPLGGCPMDSEQFPMQKPGVSPASPPPSRPPLRGPGSPGQVPLGPALPAGAPEELLQALLLGPPEPAAPAEAGPSGAPLLPAPGRLPAPLPDPE